MPKRRAPAKPRTTTPPAMATPSPLPHFTVVRATLVLCAALLAISAFAPSLRIWGFNHLAYYALPVRLVAIAAMAIAFVPAVARLIYRLALGFPALLARGPRTVSTIIILLVAVLATTVFFQFRTATNLLGDGQLIEQSFEAGFEGNPKVIMRSSSAIITEEKIAPGSLLAYYGAANFAVKKLNKGPGIGIRFLNCVFGGFFVFLFLVMLRDAPFGSDLKAWLAFLGLFSCATQLYFGYIENYTPLVFLLFIYVASALATLHNRAPLWLPILACVVSVYAHIQGVLFVPSLVFLVVWYVSAGRRRTVMSSTLTVLVSLILVGAVAARFIPVLAQFYLPLTATDEGDGILSPGHLVDILNEILMLMPVIPFVLVMAWATRGTAENNPPRQKKGGWFTQSAEWQFVGLILLPCLLYIVLFNVEIGMARDWDLFAMTVVALVPLVLLVVNRYTANAEPRRVALIAGPVFVIMLVFGVSWFGVNASSARSTERFEHILAYDQTHASYAYENLAIFYYDSGDLERAVETMETATEISRNPRQYVRLAMYLEEVGRKEEAIQVLRDILVRRPAYLKARYKLIEFLQKRGDWNAVLVVAREGVQVDPKDPVYHFYLGQSLISSGDIEGGLRAFRTCMQLGPPPRARAHIEKAFKTYEKSEE